MAKDSKKWSRKPAQKLEEVAKQIKNDQEMLVNVTEFMDIYNEVVVWNKLIHEKKLDIASTVHHREVDNAFCNKKVCEFMKNERISPCVCILLYHHAHRND